MKKGFISLSVSIVLLVVLFLGCEKSNDLAGRTAATPHAAVTLPPENDSYTVIGVVKGLSSYVIQYDENMFRGGEPTAQEGVQELKEQGIATIISVTPTDLERQQTRQQQINLVELPFEKKTLSPQTLRVFLQLIDENKGPFYVHCHGGIHRAAALCMTWRIYRQNWDYDKALIEFGRLGGSLKEDNTMLEIIRSYRPGDTQVLEAVDGE